MMQQVQQQQEKEKEIAQQKSKRVNVHHSSC